MEESACTICLCEYDTEVNCPRVLSCGHTICTQCLIDMRTKGKIDTCPFDKKKIKFFKRINEIPKNYSLLALINSKINATNEIEQIKKELEQERMKRAELEQAQRNLEQNMRRNSELMMRSQTAPNLLQKQSNFLQTSSSSSVLQENVKEQSTQYATSTIVQQGLNNKQGTLIQQAGNQKNGQTNQRSSNCVIPVIERQKTQEEIEDEKYMEAVMKHIQKQDDAEKAKKAQEEEEFLKAALMQIKKLEEEEKNNKYFDLIVNWEEKGKRLRVKNFYADTKVEELRTIIRSWEYFAHYRDRHIQLRTIHGEELTQNEAPLFKYGFSKAGSQEIKMFTNEKKLSRDFHTHSPFQPQTIQNNSKYLNSTLNKTLISQTSSQISSQQQLNGHPKRDYQPQINHFLKAQVKLDAVNTLSTPVRKTQSLPTSNPQLLSELIKQDTKQLQKISVSPESMIQNEQLTTVSKKPSINIEKKQNFDASQVFDLSENLIGSKQEYLEEPTKNEDHKQNAISEVANNEIRKEDDNDKNEKWPINKQMIEINNKDSEEIDKKLASTLTILGQNTILTSGKKDENVDLSIVMKSGKSILLTECSISMKIKELKQLISERVSDIKVEEIFLCTSFGNVLNQDNLSLEDYSLLDSHIFSQKGTNHS